MDFERHFLFLPPEVPLLFLPSELALGGPENVSGLVDVVGSIFWDRRE